MNFKLNLETKKQKITALIIAIVSVILCVAIVLLTVSSCSADEPHKKAPVEKVVKKKVIVVKKPDTATDPDADTGEELDKNTYYDVVDEDYDGPEEVVDIVEVPEEDDSSNDSENDSPKEEAPGYEVELEGKIQTPMSDKIAFGFWNYRPGSWEKRFGDKYGKEVDIITTCDIYNADEAKWCKENGSSGWIKTLGHFVNGTAELTEAFKQDMISTAEAYKALGVWDIIEGFHFDEPLLKLSGEQFRSLTKFLAETFPNKRIYPVCCSYEIRGYSANNTYDAISYYNCGYITDIGYDNYSELDISVQRNMVDQMKKQVGRKDVRIWLFPRTYLENTDIPEDTMIAHLNMYYKLLMEQENPGGLHMYSWGSYTSVRGFHDLIDPDMKWNYTRLLDRIIEVGKELKNTKYTYKTTKN